MGEIDLAKYRSVSSNRAAVLWRRTDNFCTGWTHIEIWLGCLKEIDDESAFYLNGETMPSLDELLVLGEVL